MKGILKEGGSGRVPAVDMLLDSVDDVPDNLGMASFSPAVSASGRVTAGTTVLIAPEEMDKVVKKSPTYRGPRQ